MAREIQEQVERWGLFTLGLEAEYEGNPFIDVDLRVLFTHGHRNVEINGFYDGRGVFAARFMPDAVGEWSFATRSNTAGLGGVKGRFECLPAGEGNHGPVRVRDGVRFVYEDGTPFLPVGTTCYVWNHQGDALEEQTLETLRRGPFNKIRMCVFPKHYDYNLREPDSFAFAGSREKGFDFKRFNPDFFHHLESLIERLQTLGIEADVILFHPYDRWGFSHMPPEIDGLYVRQVVARLSAYRNVWWSLANEYDLMTSKTLADWDALFGLVQESDPFQHPRSIHNCMAFYDHNRPWVTHCSIQHRDLSRVSEWRRLYKKPIVVDECGYEGSIEHAWGNLTPQTLTRRFWEGFVRGGHVGHGETYNTDGVLWWSHGGALHGQSPKRIAFLRALFEEAPGLEPAALPGVDFPLAAVDTRYYLIYFGDAQPSLRPLVLPDGKRYRADLIDTWNMTVTEVDGSFSGKCVVPLPAKPDIALRLREV